MPQAGVLQRADTGVTCFLSRLTRGTQAVTAARETPPRLCRSPGTRLPIRGEQGMGLSEPSHHLGAGWRHPPPQLEVRTAQMASLPRTTLWRRQGAELVGHGTAPIVYSQRVISRLFTSETPGIQLPTGRFGTWTWGRKKKKKRDFYSQLSGKDVKP